MAPSDDPLVPVTVIVGEEEFLADRAVSTVIAAARERDPDTEVRQLHADGVTAGVLPELVQPTLFGTYRVVVVRSVQDLDKQAAGELATYLSHPGSDMTVVLTHAGGKKGAKILETAESAGARRVNCPKVTKPRERLDFIRGEIHGAGRTITEEAARSLLDAVGGDLRELANACSQLVADTTGAIDPDTVARYHRGRVEVSGFTVADRAVEGRSGDALEQLRWALQAGVSPVLITSALAQGLRAIAKVGGASGTGSGSELARELGMPAWKVDRVRQQLRGWTPEGISSALQSVAEADAQVKGGGADAEYALERAVLAITTARQR